MAFVDQLIDTLNTEWNFFGKDEAGGGDKKVGGKPKETVKPFSDRVGDYWLSIPTAEYNDLVKKFAKSLGKLDGTVTALPWSAAFISYCMQFAGAGNQFPYAAGHTKWIVQSIKNKEKDKTKAGLVGYKKDEMALRVGDLVGAPRQNGVTYNNATSVGWFKSHTDVIVEIDLGKKVAYAIGGNVSQSVARTRLSITSDGKLNDTSRPWFVHIRNNIELKPAGAPSTEAPHAG